MPTLFSSIKDLFNTTGFVPSRVCTNLPDELINRTQYGQLSIIIAYTVIPILLVSFCIWKGRAMIWWSHVALLGKAHGCE